MTIEPGIVLLGRYRVDAIVGRGGMGVVAAAWDTELQHHVAIKVLGGLKPDDREAIERFLREARIAVRLQSDHVVRVMHVGSLAAGAPYMIMELLEGHDLAKKINLSAPGAVDCVLQAIDAIAEAHAHGVVHRDLKPSNLFFSRRIGAPPIIKVLDFGISKVPKHSEDSVTTGPMVILGTPEYMSPEQFRSPKTVDVRTDVWALGAITYELLCGERPFNGTWPEVFDAVLHSEPRSIRSRRPTVPVELEQVVLRCLRKTPDERYATVAELAQALAPFGTGEWQRCVERANALQSLRPAGTLTDGSAPEPRPSSLNALLDELERSDTARAKPGRLAWMMGALAVVVVAGGAWGLRGRTNLDERPHPAEAPMSAPSASSRPTSNASSDAATAANSAAPARDAAPDDRAARIAAENESQRKAALARERKQRSDCQARCDDAETPCRQSCPSFSICPEIKGETSEQTAARCQREHDACEESCKRNAEFCKATCG